MKRKHLFFILSIPVILILIITSTALGQNNPLENASRTIDSIKRTIEAETTGRSPEMRTDRWKQQVYESGNLMDKLLVDIAEFRKGNDQGKMPGKNPFNSVAEKKWRNFKLMVEYRRFLEQTSEELKDRPEADLKAFRQDFSRRISEIGEKSKAPEYSEITSCFDFSAHSAQLIKKVQGSGSPKQIADLMNEELNLTRDTFLEYKTYTKDIENLYVQFVRIRKFCEGRAGVPSAMHPEKPAEHTASDYPGKRETPGYTPDGNTPPSPSGRKTPDGKKPQTNIQTTTGPDFSFSTGYPSAGQVVYFKALVDTGKYPSGKIRWFINNTQTGNGFDFSYRFKKPGTYTLTLAVTEKSGKTTKLNRIFQVSPKPMAFSYGWSPENPTRGEKVKLFIRELSGGIPPYEIRWKLDSRDAGAGNTGEADMPESPTALLTVVIKDARGCLKTASTVINAQNSALDYRFWWSNPSPVPGQNVQFAVVDLKGGTPPYEIIWKIDGKNIGKGDKIRYVFEATGEHLLEVEVTDSKGNKLAGEKKFNIKAKPAKND
ncbi:MAG: hypothetical protein LWY06_03390 [Firmicutes bacterium]|nr:hypothetical protein [Bacillota bacterium]